MVDAWSKLPETIKIGIVATVKAAHLEWWKNGGGLRFGGSIMAVRRNPGGRPSKFTTPAALAVVAELCRGGSLEAAAKSAGVGLSTLYRWLELGRRGDPRFSPLAAAVPAATSAGRTRFTIGEFRSILKLTG